MDGMRELDFYLNEFGDTYRTRLTYYKTYLHVTDYIGNKIAEYIYLGKELDNDYSEILIKRQEARTKINELTPLVEKEEQEYLSQDFQS